MKSSWNSYKTAYDDIIRSIQTFLNIKEKVSALNEYNKVKDMLAKSISTANSNYNSSKINFNTALKAAQKKARETVHDSNMKAAHQKGHNRMTPKKTDQESPSPFQTQLKWVRLRNLNFSSLHFLTSPVIHPAGH